MYSVALPLVVHNSTLIVSGFWEELEYTGKEWAAWVVVVAPGKLSFLWGKDFPCPSCGREEPSDPSVNSLIPPSEL